MEANDSREDFENATVDSTVDMELQTPVQTPVQIPVQTTAQQALMEQTEFKPIFPTTDKQLQLQLRLHTIPENTTLYHGTFIVESFSPQNIRLGKETLAAMFTSTKQMAADYINSCADAPNKQGYIHEFRTNKPIDNIHLINSYEKQSDWDLKMIANKFCGSNPEYGRLNGVGFTFPNTSIDGMNTIEYALCNPSDGLQYIGTYRCVSARQLSEQYNFTNVQNSQTYEYDRNPDDVHDSYEGVE